VAEVRKGSPPSLESDLYVPLKIVWVEPKLGPLPVYVRASGLAGGELEFTIDRASGELLYLTVLSLGAVQAEQTPTHHEVGDGEGCCLVFDRTLWLEHGGSVIDVGLFLDFYSLPSGLRIDVAGVEPVRRVQCGPSVTLVVDDDGFIASLVARIAIDPHHFP